MVKNALSFLALNWLLAFVLVACKTGRTPAHTVLWPAVHMTSATGVPAAITVEIGPSVT